MPSRTGWLGLLGSIPNNQRGRVRQAVRDGAAKSPLGCRLCKIVPQPRDLGALQLRIKSVRQNKKKQTWSSILQHVHRKHKEKEEEAAQGEAEVQGCPS